MPVINITVTDEQLKAVNAVVEDAQDWLQKAFDGKAATCTKRIMREQSNLNVDNTNEQERSDWIRDNNILTRVERDAAERAANPPGNPNP